MATLSHPIYGNIESPNLWQKRSKFVWLVGLGAYGTQAFRVRRELSYKKIYQLATNLSKIFDEIHALNLENNISVLSGQLDAPIKIESERK